MSGNKKAVRKQEDANKDEVCRIVVDRGMVDEHSAELESMFLSEVVPGAGRPVVLDLRNVREIDSSGIGLCVGLYKECKAGGVPCAIEAGPDMFRMFSTLGLDRVLEVREGAPL